MISEIHILKEDLKCNKFKLNIENLKLFNKDKCSIILPLVDNKNNKNKKIYRVCLCINKNFNTGFHTNPLNLKLIVYNIFGNIAINNNKLNLLVPHQYNYNEKIKITSKKNISLFILLRKINLS